MERHRFTMWRRAIAGTAMVFVVCGMATIPGAEPTQGAGPGAATLQPGTRVRVHSPQLSYFPIVGSFVAARADTVEFQGRAEDIGERRFVVPLATIDRLDVSLGRKGNGRLGMVVGAVVFAGLAAIITPNDEGRSSLGGFNDERLNAAVGGALLGLLWGGVVGHYIKTERWKTVSLHAPDTPSR